MTYTTVTEVVARFDEIIAHAKRDQDRIGYFAALYCRVTRTIKQAVDDGTFEHGENIERIILGFAGRYFEAMDAYRAGSKPSESWAVAFKASEEWPPVLIQHLGLGMNAHINLDLGVAIAQVFPGDKIDAFAGDYDKVNDVLFSLMDEIVREFGQVWPIIKQADRFLRGSELSVLDFDMQSSRKHAWDVAKRLAHLEGKAQIHAITEIDHEVGVWGRKIWKPIFPIRVFLYIFRLTDRLNTAHTIDILNEPGLKKTDVQKSD